VGRSAFGRILRQVAETRLARPRDRPAIGPIDPREHAHERRLAGAVRADERDLLAVANDAREIAKDLLRAEMPLEAGKAK